MEKKTKYWFTIGLRLTSLLDRDKVVARLEEEFYIKCKCYGTGKRGEKQADFYVLSKEKRSLIREFIKTNIGCKFYSYKSAKPIKPSKIVL
jgi:hypothetical protein